MPLRIVHLSDLHYPRINLPLWASVKTATQTLRPDLIIVSGDLVDQPLPDQLDWAKRELEALRRATNVPLYLVPGNHDVFENGNAVGQTRKDWFDRAFRDSAEVLIVPAPAAPVKKPSAWSSFWRGVDSFLTGGAAPKELPQLAAAPPLPSLIRQPKALPVLLALFDSNPGGGEPSFAGGAVPPADLTAVATELGRIDTPHLLRIAVIHHHLQQIANTDARLDEPFMVLRNAGTVMDVLARYRFDLVLHGHKHRQQFSRIEPSPEDPGGYPIAVASAAATALVSLNVPRDCGFNVIDVADNGRITVKALLYGYGTVPRPDGVAGTDFRLYVEPVGVVTRRALMRARDRHGFLCTSRVTSFEVTGNGDILVDADVIGLRALRTPPPHIARPHGARFPDYGRLAVDPALDEKSFQAGCRTEADTAASDAKSKKFWVRIPGEMTAEPGVTYRVHHELANSLAMTAWEAEQRRRHGSGQESNEEWVGAIVDYPAEELVINLVLPADLDDTQPYVICKRVTRYPDYDIQPDCHNAIIPDDEAWVDDPVMTRHIEAGLTYLAKSGTWRLTVERPMVGYRYQLRWKLPDPVPPEPVPTKTQAWRKSLLTMGQIFHGTRQTPPVDAARNVFHQLSDGLTSMLAGGEPDERLITALFAYDDTAMTLRPVLSRKSWSETPINPAFCVPLGDGIAGAAFQQRRIVAWTKGGAASPLIHPIPYPVEDAADEDIEQANLAIPVYHPAVQNQPHPSPWATIGVVCISSSSLHSRIHPMCGRIIPEETVELVKSVHGFTQVIFNGLLTELLVKKGV